MKSKITVIVPIYNVEKYISKCLKSLVSQTFKEFEVWAIDDGSPDNSKEIVKEFQRKDNRIKLIEKNNGGYGSVLKYAIDHITTKYFLICDPDDWLKDTALEELYSFSEKNQLDVAIGDKYNVYMDNTGTEYISTFENAYKVKPMKVYTDSENIAMFSFGYVSPHAKLYRTEISKGINFPKKVSYTDFALYILSLNRANRVAYYNKALAYYLTDRPGNTATDIRISKIDDYLIGCEYVLQQLRSTQSYNVYLFRIYAQFRYAFHQYALITSNPLKDEYGIELINFLKNLQKYKTEIMSVAKNNVKDYVLCCCLMNKSLYKSTLKLLLKVDRNKK